MNRRFINRTLGQAGSAHLVIPLMLVVMLAVGLMGYHVMKTSHADSVTPASSAVAAVVTKKPFMIPLFDYTAADWSSACTKTGNTGSFIIANAGNPGGPGTIKDPHWSTNIGYCKTAKTGVLGYVDTNYCKVSLATAEAQVSAWYTWYQANGITGIMFDRTDNPANPASVTDCLSGTKSATSYYQTLAQFVHKKALAQTVVYNFGVSPATNWAFASTTAALNADTIITFENTYAVYTTWKAPTWEASYSAKHFALIAHHNSGTGQPATFCTSSAAKNLGYVYTTSLASYTTLPPATFFASEIAKC